MFPANDFFNARVKVFEFKGRLVVAWRVIEELYA
jgi:hypothetical protein